MFFVIQRKTNLVDTLLPYTYLTLLPYYLQSSQCTKCGARSCHKICYVSEATYLGLDTLTFFFLVEHTCSTPHESHEW